MSSSAGFGAADDTEFGGASTAVTPLLPAPSASVPAASSNLDATASFLEAELQLLFSHGVRCKDATTLYFPVIAGQQHMRVSIAFWRLDGGLFASW